MNAISTYENTYFFIFLENTFIEPHRHGAYELIYYVEGTGESITKNHKYSYNPFTFFICPPGTTHHEIHSSITTVVCITFYLADGFTLDEGLYYDFDKKILDLINNIKKESYNKPAHHHKMLSALTESLIVTLIRNLSVSSADDNIINKVKKYINENFFLDISVEEMAKQAGYSYDHFRHLFKTHTGMSPKQYLINKRLNHAKKLLSTSTMYISDISMISGFPNISEFSMLFKKYTGLSPSDYRKRPTQTLFSDNPVNSSTPRKND